MTKFIKLCPCGTQKRYLDCCGAFHLKRDFAKTPEALMRSRYAAFVEENWDYLKRTMRSPASLKFNMKELIRRSKTEPTKWLRLEVLGSSIDPQDPSIGYVEFKAYYKGDHRGKRDSSDIGENEQDGPKKEVEHVIHENSEFHLVDGKWFYVDGK